MDVENSVKPENKRDEAAKWSAFSLALSLGYAIAIPIIVLALGGRLLDRQFGTSPLFLLIGVSVSIILSRFGVYYRIKKIIK
jgi:F0F1-type ATP synthase assembly protein I